MPLVVLLGLDLSVILAWATALACCILVIYIAKAFFGNAAGILGKLPVVGGWIDSSLTSIEHKIVGVMSGAAAACDARMGAALHTFARLSDWLGEEIARHANLLWTLASLVLGSTTTELLREFVRLLTHGIRSVNSAVTHALHRLDTLEKLRAHGLTADVLPRVKSLEGEVAHVIEHTIPSLRARERALEDGALNTWKWIRTHPLSLASTAFAGAVAIALQRLGASWIRCDAARGLFRRRGCNAWSELETLLVAAAAVELPFTLELLAEVGKQVIADGAAIMAEVK